MPLADVSNHELEAALLCLLLAAVVGGIVFAVLEYGFGVAWARVTGALTFLVVLALCFLD